MNGKTNGSTSDLADGDNVRFPSQTWSTILQIITNDLSFADTVSFNTMCWLIGVVQRKISNSLDSSMKKVLERRREVERDSLTRQI